MLSGIESYFGSSWGTYVNTLDQLVNLTPAADPPAYDANQLFNIAFQQISGLGVASISGTVLDATSDSPLAGVVVNDVRANLQSTPTATTDATGAFLLTQLSAGVQNLSVVGYLITAGSPVVLATNADASGVVIRATKAGQINGGVIAATNGSALSNAQVYCAGSETNHNIAVMTTTNGSYQFPTLSADTYTLSFSANGFAGTTITNITVALGQIRSNVNVSLTAGATISGTVSNEADAAPLAGATVFLQDQITAAIFAGFTDTNGTYSVGNLPSATYTIACSLFGYVSQSMSAVQVAPSELSGNNTFSLSAGGNVAGTVTNVSIGGSVADAGLVLSDSIGDQFYATTDTNGVFTFTNVPAAAYTLLYLPTNALPAQLTLEVEAGETLSGIILQVHVGATITGTVVDPATQMPLANVAVIAITPDGDMLETQSDANGNYSFTLLAATGTYQVSVMGDPENSAVNVNVLQLAGVISAPALDVNPSASITGVLQDTYGHPIQGSVILYEDGQLITTSQCDTNGRYGFLILQPGQFDLQGIANSASFEAVGINVNVGDNLAQDIVAGSSTVTLPISTPDASPVGTAVNLYQYTSNGVIYCCTATAGASSNATFSGLVTGKYRVSTATSDNYGALQDVSIDGPTNVSPLVLTQVFSLNGVVTSVGAQPVNGATVLLTDSNRSLNYFGQSGNDGSYSIADIQTGAYTLAVV
ncbi:hypothetical protein SBV1_1230025 [Verrucomicrobia bacterium]|nr:hypothetical protein SBV1_1230025 [Verrucomicrobiota bacterium]